MLRRAGGARAVWACFTPLATGHSAAMHKDAKGAGGGTEEEKALAQKYEALRRKKEEKERLKAQAAAAASGQPAAAAPAAAAAQPAAPAAAAEPSAPAAAAAPSTAKAAAVEETNLAAHLMPRAAVARPVVAAKVVEHVPLPPKKVMSAKEAAAALLARTGALPSAAASTPVRASAGGATPGAASSILRRAGAAAASTPASAVRPGGAGGAAGEGETPQARPSVKRPAMRGSTDAKRPKVEVESDERLNKLWSKAKSTAEPAQAQGESIELRRVFVGDLPDIADDAELRNTFLAFGKITEAKVLPRGNSGHVTFADAKSAEDAVEASAAHFEQRGPPVIVAGRIVFVEWPRGTERAHWRAGPEAAAFLQAPQNVREEQIRRLVMQAAESFYSQGGALPDLPQGPDRELVSYGDLL